ncbi:MAG: hypothetical protein ACOZCO_07635 [Bacteroidota bacterium]
MPRTLAHIFSVVLHPLFMPLYALFILFHSDSWINDKTPGSSENFFYLFSLMIMVLMPALSIYILIRNKMVSDTTISRRSERFGPYGITVFYYALFYILIRKIEGIPIPMLSVSLGAASVILVVMVLNYFFKVSAHMAGLAGLAGLYTGLCSNLDIFPEPWVLIAIVMACGLAGVARLIVTDHSQKEIYAGAMVGFLVEYLVVKNQVWV